MKPASAFVGSWAVAVAHAISVSVAATGGTSVSPLMYGIMFEDINYCGDGGIYAELIRNRAFQSGATLDPWKPYGDAKLVIETSNPPLSAALPRSLHVSGSGGEIGISNPGWWGIEVKPQTYTGSFYVKGDHSGSFTAALRSTDGAVLTSVNIPSSSVAGKWTKHSFILDPTRAAAGVDNAFTITYTGGAALDFNLVSLFPPTWNNRTNGMRRDLMQALADLKPSFLRFPGGNNVEGGDFPREWKWNQTIGDLTQRPGRYGTWGYWNTDGQGLIEYMLWCQDLGMEPVLAVFAGLYLHNISSLIPERSLQPYVDSAMNQLEFLMGNASTTYGAKRIALGYPEPFMIRYLEVGNEDDLNGGLASYNAYRFTSFYKAIISKYPDMTVISSTPSLSSPPGTVAVDYHEYADANTLASQFSLFDKSSTVHQTLIGEYAMQRGTYPNWLGAVAEAIFELGAEKNGDRVIGMSYAPLFMNNNTYQWSPDLITFTADSSQTTLSTSYRQIKLLSNNRITKSLPLTNSDKMGPAYWIAGFNENNKHFVFKAAVYNSTTAQPFNVMFPGLTAGAEGTLTVLTSRAGPAAYNAPGKPEVVNETISKLAATSSGFGFNLPELSVAVLSWKSK